MVSFIICINFCLLSTQIIINFDFRLKNKILKIDQLNQILELEKNFA